MSDLDFLIQRAEMVVTGVPMTCDCGRNDDALNHQGDCNFVLLSQLATALDIFTKPTRTQDGSWRAAKGALPKNPCPNIWHEQQYRWAIDMDQCPICGERKVSG